MIRYSSLIAGADAVVTAATSIIFERAEASSAKIAGLLPAPAITFDQPPSYARNGNFVGIIRAANDSTLGFEVADTINQLYVRDGM